MREFEQVYRQYYRDVFRFVLCLANRQPDIAEEITQECFFRVYQGLLGFEGRSQMKTWIFQIARNVWVDYTRKKRPVTVDTGSIAGSPATCHTDGPEEEALGEVVKAQIDLYLKAMDSRTRDIVTYRLYFDLSFKDIAELVGLSENSARVVYHRSKLQLRKLLQKEMEL